MRRPKGIRPSLTPVACVVLCLGLGCVWASQARVASASSTSQITITPSSGPVGTPVHVTITPSQATTTSADYVLGTTTTEPNGPTCADSRPIPGLAPITVSPSGGQADFAWPEALNGGPYWLCAASTDGNAPGYRSYQPFTVLSGGGTATPTTAPTPGPTATITTSVDGIRPGAALTVLVANWHSRAGTPPSTVSLTTQDPTETGQPGAGRTYLQFSIASQDSAGTFTLAVTLPQSLASGTYWLHIADGATDVATQSFAIGAPPNPGGTSSESHSAPGGAAAAMPIQTIIIAGLGVLLVMLLGIFAVGRLRRP